MEKQKRDILDKQDYNKSEMIRFVVGPKYKIFADLEEKLPGRGMWLRAGKSYLQEAIEKRAFNKASKYDCKFDDDFIEQVKELLKKRVLSLLSLSKRTGELTLGFENILEKLKYHSSLEGESKSSSERLDGRKNKKSIILIASDSGEDGKKKLHKYTKTHLLIDTFTGSELQHAFGQDTVVVYGLIHGSNIAEKIALEYKKLNSFLLP